MDNKVKYGLSNVYYAKATIDDDGTITYDSPLRIRGAVNLTLDPEGDLSPWYADNTIYTILNSNVGYSGELEVALIPPSFLVSILHEYYDSNSAMIEALDQPVEHFALMFQVEGDRHCIRHVFYNCICNRPKIESSTTEDTKEPQTDTLEFLALPRADGLVRARTGPSTTENIYDGWFDEVYEPDKTEPEPTVTHTVRFYNGTTLLQTVEVEDGKDATYTGSTPVSSDDPTASFIGWEPEPKNVTSDMDCYAQFEYKTYTVEFWNGDTLLQTVTVKYGENATYTGSTPVSPDNPDWEFIGWEPEPINITADTKCYAQYNSIYAFAFYSENDNSLNFYYGEVPKEGTIYDSKTVTNIYTGFNTRSYQNHSDIPWYENIENIITVNFDESFEKVQPTSMKFWFSGFSNCTEINGLEYLDTSHVTSMYYAFESCRKLTSLDVSNFNTSSVTEMYYTFAICNSLKSLDLSNFDTSSVTTMMYMFGNCYGLTTLDVSNFNTNLVENMSYMFYSCTNLTTIYSNDNNFTTAKVTADQYMFNSCRYLVGGNGTSYAENGTSDSTMAHVDTASNPGYFTAK